MFNCECVLWINGIELNWFWVSIVQTRSRWVVVFVDLIHLDYCQCLLVYWTPSVPCSKGASVAARYPIHPTGYWWKLWWFKLVHFNSWLWHLITHGHNATWRCHWDTFKVSGLNSNNWNCLLQDICDMGILVYESTCCLVNVYWSDVTCLFCSLLHVLTKREWNCAEIAKCTCWGIVFISCLYFKSVYSECLVSVLW